MVHHWQWNKGHLFAPWSIKVFNKVNKPNLCDYSDAYILVTGDIAVKRRNAADTADIELAATTQGAFKNCAPFKDCR